MRTAKLRDEKEVLDRQQHADMEAQKNLEENLQQLLNRENELDSQEEQMRSRLKRIMDSSARHKDDLAELNKELRALQDKSRKSRLVIVYSFSRILTSLYLCVLCLIGSTWLLGWNCWNESSFICACLIVGFKLVAWSLQE